MHTEIRLRPCGEVVIRTRAGAEADAREVETQNAPLSITANGHTPDAYGDLVPLTELGIKLCVFDMAGTTVDEGGLVYDTLKRVMREASWEVNEDEFNKWHGANKKEVVQHFAKVNQKDGLVDEVYGRFETELEAVYFNDNSPVKAMPGVHEYFTALRKAGIKIGLDTGFPRKIADHIIKQLGFEAYIDGSCVSMEVGHGRPYPYMIYNLMHKFGIARVSEVAKFGDTVRDIEEGQHAGTPYTYGCLSGADNAENLTKAGAYRVVNTVMDVPVTPEVVSGKRKLPVDYRDLLPAKRKFANGVL